MLYKYISASRIKATLYIIIFSTVFISCAPNNSKNYNTNTNSFLYNKDNIDRDLATRTESTLKKLLCYGPTAIYLYDITANKSIYSYNKDSLMHSASCLKLLTGIAGLKFLGTDYYYNTKIFIKGRIEKNTLKGDVTFKTSLDPQFLTQDINLFTDKLKQKGIKQIEGNIIIDVALSEPVKAEEHWYPWDLTFNKYGIFYKGTERITRDLKSSLNSRGIKYHSNNIQLGKLPKGSKCIYSLCRPIANIVSRMWQHSSNTQSTSLLYTIGYKQSPNGNFTNEGIEYLKKFIEEELELPASSAIIHDGCGLCIHNKITPELLVALLKYGYNNKQICSMLRKYLPIAGVSGSLRTEMTRSKARGKIQAKTGTLSHPYGISTLAGYCVGKNGHQLCFAIMCHSMSALDGRMIQKKLCEQFIE